MAENEQGATGQDNAAQPAEPVAAEPVAAGQGQVSKDARNMALLCHLLAIFTGFLGPLILWLLKKDDDSFIDEHGKEALNFQIALLDVTTGEITLLTHGPYHNENPRWSPAGRHIVFSSNRSGSYDVYTMAADGSDVRRLTRGTNSITPDWSR